MRSSLR